MSARALCPGAWSNGHSGMPRARFSRVRGHTGRSLGIDPRSTAWNSTQSRSMVLCRETLGEVSSPVEPRAFGGPGGLSSPNPPLHYSHIQAADRGRGIARRPCEQGVARTLVRRMAIERWSVRVNPSSLRDSNSPSEHTVGSRGTEFTTWCERRVTIGSELAMTSSQTMV